ncbi:MAG: hypothetical protein ACI4EB_07815 [Bilifractor sp.]
MEKRTYPKEFSRTIRCATDSSPQTVRIRVTLDCAGEDLLLFIRGGREHIGSVVLTQPRESLKSGNNSISCTSSVLNVTGHKDEDICRYLAEQLSCASGRRVAAVGGIHVEGLQPEGIQAICHAAGELAEEIAGEFF